MTANRKGYLIPSEPEPEGHYCLSVYVPRDVLYLRNFFGALDFFGKWLAHDDAGSGAAKLAADRWKIANEMTRTAFALGECTEMAFELRQNPENNCQIEQSIDNGETWTLAYDFSLCDVFAATVPPFPGTGTGDRDAASNAIFNVWLPLLLLANEYCGETQAEYITAATAMLQVYNAGYVADAALGDLYDLWCGMTEEEQAPFLDREQYCQEFHQLSECANVEGVFDALDCLNEKLTEWLDSTNTDLMSLLNKAAAALGSGGIQAAAGDGGGGGGAAFDDSCAWEHTFEFATAENWQAIVAYGLTLGVVTGGEWYSDELVPYPFGNRREVSIYIILPRLTNIRHVSTRYRTHSASGSYYLNASATTSVQGNFRVYDIVANNNSTETRDWDGDVDMRIIQVGVQLTAGADWVAIEEVTVGGVGINPFE